MKLKCLRCNTDWTTLSERDGNKKDAFHCMVLEQMKCPNCTASNYHLSQTKKKRGTRKGYAGWGNSCDRPQPNIIIHPQCQPYICGNLNNLAGVTCECDNTCSSYFNCWTGNVDDGEYKVPMEKPIEERRKEAQALVAKTQINTELDSLRTKMGKIGFSYFFKGVWYAKCGGTIWKLTAQDMTAILELKWDTAQAQVISRTLTKAGVDVQLVKSLLNVEMLHRQGMA